MLYTKSEPTAIIVCAIVTAYFCLWLRSCSTWLGEVDVINTPRITRHQTWELDVLSYILYGKHELRRKSRWPPAPILESRRKMWCLIADWWFGCVSCRIKHVHWRVTKVFAPMYPSHVLRPDLLLATFARYRRIECEPSIACCAWSMACYAPSARTCNILSGGFRRRRIATTPTTTADIYRSTSSFRQCSSTAAFALQNSPLSIPHPGSGTQATVQ